MTDADYLYAFQRIVMPIAYEFAPDFVLGESTLDAIQLLASSTTLISMASSLCWFRCRRGRHPRGMSRYASGLRSHDAHAVISRKWSHGRGS